MSRPQVSIDRLAPRRVMTEPRESMNCKSCRKRKIKCNRVRPSCEACKVFQCPCIYDAIPKKRGPKTDVLEALLKRVDGLERRLQEENNNATPTSENPPATGEENENTSSVGHSNPSKDKAPPKQSSPAVVEQPEQSPLSFSDRRNSILLTPTYNGYADHPLSDFRSQQQTHRGSRKESTLLSDAILDTFFSRIHGKPFYVLEESSTRQKHHLGQLPSHMKMAIYAITVRYIQSLEVQEHPVHSGLDYALKARQEIDSDNPTIEGLQSLLLLSMVFFAYGMGKKTYMTLSSCSAMVLALDLYRESSPKLNLSRTEKETRRRIFWTCYIMDRFATSGSKRPCLISDHSILLRLPSWSSNSSSHSLPVEGDVFNNQGSNIQFSIDPRKRGQPAMVLLIDIVRILGITNRYLATGGVKGDSHFPWHSMSTLSKIRQELDIWGAGVQDTFISVESLFNHPEGTTLFLSKLIYHLIHCLIYRPFLPLDLAELRGTGQHQSWQIEATNLCFLHSNAIAELVEFARNTAMIEWPAFISHCVCTAGTVHVHGVHYKGLEGEVFSSSADFLAKEMQQMSWLRQCWAGVQHQRELLQTVYTCHSELVRNLATSTMRFSPVFHLEDFFDRYMGVTVDSSHVRLVDEVVDYGNDTMSIPLSLDGHSIYNAQTMAAPPLSTPRSLPSQQQSHHIPRVDSSNIQFQQQQQQQQAIEPMHNSRNAELSGLQFDNMQNSTSHVHPSLYPYGLNGHSQTPFSSVQQQPNQRMHTAFSPTLGLSPTSFMSEALATTTAPTPPSNFQYATFPFDVSHGTPTIAQMRASQPTGVAAQTPSGQSQTSESHSHATISENGGPPSEKDPFLSLLEQLAENEHLEGDGPSELDYLLSSGIHNLSGNEPNPSEIEDGTTSAGRDALDATGQAFDHGTGNEGP